jgi:GH15 family glucan-1,4-alpha-glucosidase
MRTPKRTNGFAPIEDYALIGDGRTAALVALDGSIDWLCLPDIDAPPVLAALLDPEDGGRFTLRPRGEFQAQRRYVDDSNLLQTVYTTATGTAKVTDAFLTDGGALLPWVELVRKIEGIEGDVELEWRLEARPRWGAEEVQAAIKENVGIVEWDGDAIAVLSYDCGKTHVQRTDLHGRFTVSHDSSALLGALYFDDDPYAFPPRDEFEVRLERTREYWQTYTREIPYDGPWLESVRRSVLTQRLLTYAPTGAIAAAPTTSLPERIGGERNYDYRFSWVRDTSLALESLLAVRLTVECQRSLAWVVDATREQKQLQPMYTLSGEARLPRLDIDVRGYRDSRPVRVGNDAEGQLQLGGYADVIAAAHRFCAAGNMLDPRTAERCAELADDVCSMWRREDSGIWEIDPRHYTQSKLACWGALAHAVDLAEHGRLPDDRVKTWKQTQREIHQWVEEGCFSEARNAYTMWPGSDELDASILLAARFGYFDDETERFESTIEALRRELGAGPFLYRTSGLRGEEGCFLACSFWLVGALTHLGRLEEAHELMDELLGAANDVGLYAEQIDPSTRAHLGNFPQALSHLSLVLAAVSVMHAERNAV